MTLLELLLAAWSTYRLTRLVTTDTILDRPRDAFLRWAERRRHAKAAEFIVCPHCVGMWIGAVATLAAYLAPGGRELAESAWFVAPASVLFCSAVTSVLSTLTES